MKKITLLLSLFVGFLLNASGQTLLEPSFRFSGQKPIYVTMEDGTEMQGTLKKLKRKKGLIRLVIIKDAKGEKHELQPEDIKFMYLFPSGVDGLARAVVLVHDATKWGNTYVKPGLIAEGYVYFEKSKVKVNKKERTLLMQVLNPSFGGDIRVYHDPFASETASLGVAGIKVAGGIAKSYYIRKGNEVAIRVKKKNYKKKVFGSLFGDCKKMAKKFPKVKWSDLADHVDTYGKCKE